MSQEILCVCGHIEAKHDPGVDKCIAFVGKTMCCCPEFRPLLDWPDVEGWWWSKNQKAAVEVIPFARRDGVLVEVCIHYDGFSYHADDWMPAFGPDDKFTRCERCPFPDSPTR